MKVMAVVVLIAENTRNAKVADAREGMPALRGGVVVGSYFIYVMTVWKAGPSSRRGPAGRKLREVAKKLRNMQKRC